MDDGRIQRLRFTLSDQELNEIIDALSDFGASWLHRNAWETLMSEIERRQDGEARRDVDIMSGVFDTLPAVVQAMLRNHVSPEARRVA
jgi:hypothetical protein